MKLEISLRDKKVKTLDVIAFYYQPSLHCLTYTINDDERVTLSIEDVISVFISDLEKK